MTRPDDAATPDDTAGPSATPLPDQPTGTLVEDPTVTGSAVDSTAPDSAFDDSASDGTAEDPDGVEPSAGEREWAWVTRWREEKEPTPWGPGLVLAVFTAVLVAVAVVVLTQGLGDLPLLAVLINIVVGAGLAPAIWMVRSIPVVRWIGAGMALGLVGGWCAAAAVVTTF